MLRFLITVLGIEESDERRAGPVSKTEPWCRHTFAAPLFFSQAELPKSLRHQDSRLCSGGTSLFPRSSEAVTGDSRGSGVDASQTPAQALALSHEFLSTCLPAMSSFR